MLDRKGLIYLGDFTISLPDFSHEWAAIQSGFIQIAGVDEVGRGSLAGPVTAAAVILNPKNIPSGLNDSKKLSPARREALFHTILRDAAAICLAHLPAEEIDRINIRQASLRAMELAIEGLNIVPDLIFVDGRDIPPGFIVPARAIIRGDAKLASIAAASIVAKVSRDHLMQTCAAHWPHYGFATNMGYGTIQHLNAITKAGPCPLHRRSFAPLAGTKMLKKAARH